MEKSTQLQQDNESFSLKKRTLTVFLILLVLILWARENIVFNLLFGLILSFPSLILGLETAAVPMMMVPATSLGKLLGWLLLGSLLLLVSLFIAFMIQCAKSSK